METGYGHKSFQAGYLLVLIDSGVMPMLLLKKGIRRNSSVVSLEEII